MKPTNYPMEQGLKFFKHNGELLTDPTSYQRLTGRLLYLTHTHLDLRYSVHTLSQFMEAPRKTYLNVGRHIHWYIKATPGQGICFFSTSILQLESFLDSDWTACLDTCMSIIGFCVFLGDSLISWKSKK